MSATRGKYLFLYYWNWQCWLFGFQWSWFQRAKGDPFGQYVILSFGFGPLAVNFGYDRVAY